MTFSDHVSTFSDVATANWHICWKMAVRRNKDCELVYFTTQCRGVKFYHFRDGGVDFGDKLAFVRKPHHFKDPNCVEVRVVSRGRSLQLGHVAAEAAEWLSPLLIGPFRITG